MVPLASERNETQVHVHFGRSAGRKGGGSEESVGGRYQEAARAIAGQEGGQNGVDRECVVDVRINTSIPPAALCPTLPGRDVGLGGKMGR